MKHLQGVTALTLALLTSGCTSLQYGGGRVVVLVLVPAAIIALVLYLLRRRNRGPDGGRGPRYPDYDDRE